MEKKSFVYLVFLAFAPPEALADDNPLDEPTKNFREASDYVQKTGVNVKIPFCEFTDATEEKVKQEEEASEHASHKVSEKLTKRSVEKIRLDRAVYSAVVDGAESSQKELALAPVEHMLDGFMIPAAATHEALTKTTGYGRQDRDRFEQLVGPGMQGMTSSPIDTSTGASDFDCKGDFDKLTSQLDQRATMHSRLATNYSDLKTQVGFRIRDYERGFEGKRFLGSGKCEGVSSAVVGIHSALEQESESLEKLAKYNKERADALSAYSGNFKDRKFKCESMLQRPSGSGPGPYTK